MPSFDLSIRRPTVVAGKHPLPGDKDVWIFILAELLMFSAFFAAYIWDRARHVEAFNTSQLLLDRRLGALNTMILITSSWLVVRSIDAARANRVAAVPRDLGYALVLAAAFVVVKAIEYTGKFRGGIGLTTNDFFMYYFCLTGLHLLHVLAGCGVLMFMWRRARAGAYGPGRTQGLEAGASYWHLVDLLWIFLFSLLYILR